ncbi:hypothetical protein [Corynebacterium sp.]|uniref:hypothetical protein n=1 Tax=Corynebacterium sp. TaxID=1720 RepID=UPI0026DBBE52|nr:hypothetical protein [Corynebacterium sp.]MDO5031015.1 hypothetical protein [Corynebacterium sp.]
MKYGKKIWGRIRNSEAAGKVVSPAYRFFDIANTSGSFVSSRGWSSRLLNPPRVSVDTLGRTEVTLSDDGPVYLVNNGTDRDFKKLGRSSGFETQGAERIGVQVSVSTTTNVRCTVVILEFDATRKRIGEATLAPSRGALVRLNPNTKYILPCLRLVGRGEISVNWISMDYSRVQGELGEGKVTQIHDLKRAGSPKLRELFERLDSTEANLNIVRDELLALELQGGDISGAAEPRSTVVSARSDGPISAAREVMVREVLSEMAASLPTSNGSRHYHKISARLGIITDEYMYNFYKDAFEEVIYLTPENYSRQLEDTPVDAILYVTCWKGLSDEEWKGVKFREKPATALDGILHWAKRHDVPTIFQSIEDPSNSDYFLPIAEKFDHVFTSDANMIAKYKHELGNENVYYGEYGANPKVNNPIGTWRHNFNRAFLPVRTPSVMQSAPGI